MTPHTQFTLVRVPTHNRTPEGRVCNQACFHAYERASVHACMHACMHEGMQACVRACVRVRMHAACMRAAVTERPRDR